MTAPWTDPTLIRAAFDIACDVRSIAPADAVPADDLDRIPTQRIADLIVTLAYMVDVDQPLAAIAARLGSLDETPRMRPCCTVGHPADQYGYWGRGTVKAQRCRQCDREIAQRAAQERAESTAV